MMSDTFEITRALQRKASNPGVSSFVSANAGSGKTYVLSMRVIRLLLNGVAPEKILCLTFTKVAAANMATRIFEILAGWTRLSDPDLKARIEAYGENAPDTAMLARARRLFALAVETPGGLKIQTIHAFCERLLHVFPFEANVPASFRVVQDLEQADLMALAQHDVLTGGDADIRAALDILVPETEEQNFSKLMTDALKKRAAFAAVIASQPTLEELGLELRAALGLDPCDTHESIKFAMLDGGFTPAQMNEMAVHLGKSALVAALSEAGRTQNDPKADLNTKLGGYSSVFFKDDGDPKIKGWLLDKQRAACPDIAARLEAERDRLSDLQEKLRAVTTARQSIALIRVVGAVMQRYRDLKAHRSSLDFDDLIERTGKLLHSDGRDWVLYKLDQGIDHILIDEAQDTSPAQWAIFRALVLEFFSGNGRTQASRTVFAVGDEKQSIYSFQGAQPQLFAENRADISKKTMLAQKKFESVQLKMSFRSSPEILAAVDRVFESSAINAQGLSFDHEGYPPHTALKLTMPGHVEIWPLFAAPPKKPPSDWLLPLDFVSESHPKVRLAKLIAETVAGWLSPDSPERVHGLDGFGRAIRAGDVLILVRSRSTFAEGLNRELKLAHVPVAGADRLKLSSHIAVLDLIAAGRAALLPLDDLQLACVLKSPLFGFDDDDLIALAPTRAGSLFGALAASAVARYAAAAVRLQNWQDDALSLSPFAFYMRILAGEHGRKAMLSRLGHEAADVIDEFLSAALTHEAAGPPSLVTFLAGLESSEAEIKRDFDAAGDAVRVMTVHSAKGLEAKIIILADTGSVPDGSKDTKFFAIPRTNASPETSPLLVWSPRKDEDCHSVRQAREAALQLALEEHRRLLYVAMTRAEERLYVAGFHTRPEMGKPFQDKHALSWYGMIKDALRSTMIETPAPWEPGEMILSRSSGALKAGAAREHPLPPNDLPAWLHTPLAFERGAEPPLRPSTILSAANGEDRAEEADDAPTAPQEQARLAGQMMHRLLQILPEYPAARREEIGQILLKREGVGLRQPLRLITQALNVLAHPELADVFSPQARAEVDISGEVNVGGKNLKVLGRVDRLAVLEREVIVVDFKTGSPRNQALGQMAIYHALLRQIYPHHRVRAALVWTVGPDVVWLDDETLRVALSLLA